MVDCPNIPDVVHDYDSVNKIFNDEKVLKVTFIKKNGDERVMTCTRKPELMPEDKRPKDLVEGEEPKVPSDINFPAFEIGVGWRSFNFDSIISIEVMEQEESYDPDLDPCDEEEAERDISPEDKQMSEDVKGEGDIY